MGVCPKRTEKLNYIGARRPVHVKEEMWDAVHRVVHDGKESKTQFEIIVTDVPWRSECARGMCEVDPDRIRASLVLRRLCMSVFILLFMEAAKNLVVQPPTVDLSLTPLLIDFSFSHRDTLTIRHGVFNKMSQLENCLQSGRLDIQVCE